MNSELERRWPLFGFQTSKIFLEGFLRLLETSENNLHSATYDNSEIWFRRLDGHERTLSTLLNRIEQTNHGVPRVDDLTRVLRTLLSHRSNLRSHYGFSLVWRETVMNICQPISGTTCFMMISFEVDGV